MSVCLLARSFVRACMRTYVRSFVRPSVRSFARSCVRAFVCLCARLCVRSCVRSFVRSIGRSGRSVVRLFTRSLFSSFVGLGAPRYLRGGDRLVGRRNLKFQTRRPHPKSQGWNPSFEAETQNYFLFRALWPSSSTTLRFGEGAFGTLNSLYGTPVGVLSPILPQTL